MAGGRSDLNIRIFTKDQNTEEENTEDQFLYDLLFMLFKKNKVEIASAITKTFPFFMGLRDRGFLSEQMYENFLDTCANLVPVERVVYDVLTELEKTFDLPLLEVLFSKVNMKAYPDLIEVYQSFQDALFPVSCGLVAVQEDEGRESEETPRLLLPYDGEESKNVCLEKCDGEEPQKASISSPRNGSVSYDPETRQMTKEVPEEMPDLLPAEGEEGGNACLGMYDGEEPQGALGSPSRSELVPCDPDTPQTNREDSEELAPTL
ncbi:nuclear body protein SP140-like isoform X1 [Loxodonta africana]|uniref:nuclear body protein SP140-like isoform X1 n=2 Tax=Loxodonta africana TaxID=9785 RepID=UPI0030CFEB08